MDDSSKKDSNDAIDATSSDALDSAGSAAPANSPDATSEEPKGKRSLLPGPLRKFSHRFNIYLLFFVLLVVVAGAILVVTALSSTKSNNNSNSVNSQSLSSDTLKQLSNSNATVGDPKQVLNVQSNAVFAGSVLIKDSLEVAGEIKVGGPLSLPGITVSGQSDFDQLNVNKNLSVGGDAGIQGQLNVKKNLAVSGSGTFGGPITAPQIATSSLQLLGDLTLTSHVIAGGSTPNHSTGGAVGGGGTSSISGSDTSGSININTGSSPSAGCMINVTFTHSYSNTPHVVITPVGSAAATVQYYVTRNSTGFSVCSANVPPAGASFGYDYFVTG